MAFTKNFIIEEISLKTEIGRVDATCRNDVVETIENIVINPETKLEEIEVIKKSYKSESIKVNPVLPTEYNIYKKLMFGQLPADMTIESFFSGMVQIQMKATEPLFEIDSDAKKLLELIEVLKGGIIESK